MTTVKERLIHFLSTLPNKKGGVGMTKGAFQTKVGLKTGSIDNMGRSLHPDTINKIKAHYPQLNELWLLHGQEPMILREVNSADMNNQNNQSSDNQEVKNNPSLEAMIESNRLMAIAHLKQVENNTELIHLLKHRTIDDDWKETQKGVSARLQVLQGFLIQDGIEKKRWKSVEEGMAKLNMLIHEMMQKGQSTDTHGDEGTTGK